MILLVKDEKAVWEKFSVCISASQATVSMIHTVSQILFLYIICFTILSLYYRNLCSDVINYSLLVLLSTFDMFITFALCVN